MKKTLKFLMILVVMMTGILSVSLTSFAKGEVPTPDDEKKPSVYCEKFMDNGQDLLDIYNDFLMGIIRLPRNFLQLLGDVIDYGSKYRCNEDDAYRPMYKDLESLLRFLQPDPEPVGVGSLEISGVRIAPSQQFEIGTVGTEIARFELEAGEEEDVNLESIVLQDDLTSISSNAYDFVLKDAETGDVIGTLGEFDDLEIDGFVLLNEPWTIQAGQSKIMVVEASITNNIPYTAYDTDLRIRVNEREEDYIYNQTVARGADSNEEVEITYSSSYGVTNFVYRTTLSGGVNASTPTGSKVPGTQQKVFSVDLTAGDARDVEFRQGREIVGCIAGLGNPSITYAHGNTAATEIQGSACEFTAIDTVTDSVAYSVGAGILNDYSYVSFWFSENDGESGTISDFADWTVATSTFATITDNDTALTPTMCGASGVTAMVDDVWYNCVVPLSVFTDANDAYLVFELDTDGGQHADDDYFLDEVYLFNDSITVDLNTNSKFYDEDVADAQGSPAVLKSGTPPLIGLAIGFTSIAADYDSIDTNTNAKVVFIPVDQVDGWDYPDFEIPKNQTRTFDVYVDTLSLLNTTASNDLLVPSISLGNGYNDGDILWYDDGIYAYLLPDSIGWVYNAYTDLLESPSPLIY